MKRVAIILGVLATLMAAGTAAAADEPPHSFSLGLAFLSTTGNSSSRTLGLDLNLKERFEPWGIEATASYLRAEKNGVLDAKKLFAGVRGTRTLAERWKAFAGASGLQDRFAGFDPRWVVEAGLSYDAVKTATQELSFDAGAAWNHEKRTTGESKSYTSGLAGLRYAYVMSPTAKLTEKLAFFPSLEAGKNWRVESDTALQASLTSGLALKLSYGFRFQNEPVPGFRSTDTITNLSLVLNLI